MYRTLFTLATGVAIGVAFTGAFWLQSGSHDPFNCRTMEYNGTVYAACNPDDSELDRFKRAVQLCDANANDWDTAAPLWIDCVRDYGNQLRQDTPVSMRYFSGGERTRVYDDEPGWNCKTMGNRVCG